MITLTAIQAVAVMFHASAADIGVAGNTHSTPNHTLPNHTLPLPHTDHFWWIDVPNHPYHPNKGAPRCLPCHYRPPPGTDFSRAPATVPYGCPCTPQRLCELDPEHKVFNKCVRAQGNGSAAGHRVCGAST